VLSLIYTHIQWSSPGTTTKTQELYKCHWITHSKYYTWMKPSNHTLSLHRSTKFRGYLLPSTQKSDLNRSAFARTPRETPSSIDETCLPNHCIALSRADPTENSLSIVEVCLPSCCLATLWQTTLQYCDGIFKALLGNGSVNTPRPTCTQQ
jgi:hypothetical protein